MAWHAICRHSSPQFLDHPYIEVYMGGEKAVARAWSLQEDDLLRTAVAIHGTQDNWKAVAEEVPGRNNKACRKRWLHSLSPMVKKTSWSTEEDNILITLFNIHGPKWSFIARQIEGRTDDACSKRYNEALDPSLKRGDWSSDEDDRLLQLAHEMGGRWTQIGVLLQRSSLACRNRFKLLERKQRTISHNPLPTTSLPPNPDLEFPYYPPESYHLYSPEDVSATFREPTPELPLAPPPPPFQFSSFSLSAALDDPSRSFQEISADHISDHAAGTSSTSSPYSYSQDINDGSMLLDDLSDSSPFTDRTSLAPYYSLPNASGPVLNETETSPRNEAPALYQSPTSIITDKLPTLELSAPHHSHLNGSPFSFTSPELSSVPSSPYVATASSSLNSSPGVSAPRELLPSEPPPAPSLLFSRATVPKEPLTSRKSPGTTRLSSVMPLSADGSLRPYACGHSVCWPAGASTSTACFSTSKDLFEHARLHPEGDEKPFRCALPGCGKSWKSLNGLQYHLQLSTAHFQRAVSNRFSSQNTDSPQANSSEITESDSPDNSEGKRFSCDQPDCFKSYKNSSGLRYHKKHGHPKTIPMQLADMPPALARDLPLRTRKMRKKEVDSSAVATAAAA